MKKPVLYTLIALIILAQLVCVAGLFVAFDIWPMTKAAYHQFFNKVSVANPDTDLVVIQDVFGRYGYMNNHGNVVVWPRFTGARSFSGGLAQVGMGYSNVEISPGETYRTSDKFGFINQTGKFIIPPKFNGLSNFSEGLAVIYVDDKYGAIDGNGNVVIAPQFPHLSDFHDGTAEFSTEASQVTKEPYYFAPKGVIDKLGRILLEPTYDDIYPKREERIRVRRNDLFGFLDPSLNVVIEPRYTFASDFKNGVAVVKDKAAQLWGIINQQGDAVLPFQYEFIEPFSEGMAAVKDPATHLWGFIDSTGKLVIPCKYLNDTTHWVASYIFHDGLACVITKENRAVLIDKAGKEVVGEFDLFTPLPKDSGVYRQMDPPYNGVLYDLDPNYGYSGNSLHWIELTPGRLAFFDNRGNPRFQVNGISAGTFCEGLCPVYKSGEYSTSRFTYIDLAGKDVFGYYFAYTGKFANGIAPVDFTRYSFSDYSYIDRTGRILWLSASVKQDAAWVAIFSFIFALLLTYIIIRAHRVKQISLP